MSDGRKRILSFFTGRTKRKVWNKTREKYMPVQIIQNLAEMDRGLHYSKKEWLEEFLDGKGTSDNGNDSADNNNDDESYNENNGICRRVLQYLQQNSLSKSSTRFD